MFPSPEARRRIGEIPLRFKNRRVLVLGDLMLDCYIRGSVSRLSPEAPVPVVNVREESFVPGGAGNVAANLAALGAEVRAIGVVGRDAAGENLSAILASLGIEARNVLADAGRVTSQKHRVVAERQQVVRYDRETPDPVSAEMEKRLLSIAEFEMPSCRAVILSDYGKGVLTPRVLAGAIALSRKAKIPVVIDPKIEHFKRYRRATCVTPNLHEAWTGMGRVPKAGTDGLEKLGRDILKTLESESVLITRGSDGMSLFEPGKALHIPAQAREVFDVSGAGDTVVAALSLALACGASLRAAAMLSNYAAGIVVGKLGTATTTVAEIREALR